MLKIIKVRKIKGFTKEQTAGMAAVVLEYLNGSKKSDLEQIEICVSGTRCKYWVKNTPEAMGNFLRKIGVKIEDSEQTAYNNNVFKTMRAVSVGNIYKQDKFYSDGFIALRADFCGEMPKDFDYKHIDNLPKIEKLAGKLKSLNGYRIEKKQKDKNKNTCVIFYKNKKDDFIVINQKYFDLLPEGCKFFANNNGALIAMKGGEVVGLIMKLRYKNLNDFELLPEILPQVNGITGQEYHGNNAEMLEKAGYSLNYWCGAYQAKKLNKQIKAGAKGYTIKIFYEDKESGRSFCKLETVYNFEELEPLQKVEKTAKFAEMLERLEA